MRDNRGVTLVELIVVMAIMAILAGAVIMSSGIIYSWQLNNGAEAFDSMYSKARLQAMVKADVTGMCLYEKDDQMTFGILQSDDTITSEATINSKITIKVTLELNDGSGVTREYIIDDTGVSRPFTPTITSGKLDVAMMQFVKGTGAERAVSYLSNVDPLLGGDYYITKVTLMLGSKEMSYSIEPVTGNLTKE